jgi:type I restriction enzyme S subunit
MNAIYRLVTDNIHLWTGADTEKKSGRGRASGSAGTMYGVKKIRELILELAVRGKLVPQDANDESASALLTRIREEKARLILDGQMKKDKPMARITAEENPFSLPNGWEWVTLAAISQVNPRNILEDNLTVSFVPMTMIGTRFNSPHDQETRFWKEVKQAFTHFSEGDIGIAKITPCFENSKACVFSGLKNRAGAGTTELHIIRPINNTLDPRYVLAYLKSPQFLLAGEARMTGTAGQKRLPKEFVESNPFPLPPLAEQHRIVAKVDELIALCDQLEAGHADATDAHEKLVSHLLATLTASHDSTDFSAGWQRVAAHFDMLFTTEASIDALKQTLMQLAVMGKLVPHDPGDEPACALLKRYKIVGGKAIHAGWCDVQLGKLGVVHGGATPSKAKHEYWNGTIPWVSPKDMKRSYIDDAEDRVSEVAVSETALKIIPAGSLLIVVRGMILIHSFPVALTTCEVTINQDMKALLIPDEIKEYVFLYLRAMKHVFVGLVDRSSHGTCKLISEKLWAVSVMIPPKKEQTRIVAKVNELMTLCDRIKTRIADANALKRNLADAMVAQAVA